MLTMSQISLGGGNPAPSTFPFQRVQVDVKPIGANSELTTVIIEGKPLEEALQYSPSYGIDRFVKLLKDMQVREHAPPYSDWHVMVTTGSQDALSKAFEMLLAPGDSIIVEDPTYSGALSALRPLEANLVGIPVDKDGMLPHVLEVKLKSWDPEKPRPKAIYTIPTGQNPSGATASAVRRQRIYEIASQYDLLILEDDPYWHIRLEGDSPPSYFSMDVDRRVLRFDSFSKVLSAGVRVGWVTGPAPLLAHLEMHQQASELHASGLSQAVMCSLLEKWGEEGWKDHVKGVQAHYRSQAHAFVTAANKYLSSDLVEWSPPTAGMFVWFKVHGAADTTALISEQAVQAKVLLVPGKAFSPSDSDSPYVRAAFSTATHEDMDEAMRRFSLLLRNEI